MKLRALTVLSVVAVIIAGSAIAAEATKEAKKVDLAKIKCIMSGKAVAKDATADFNGGKVYFCCKNCVAKFEKDNTKFVSKANHQLALTEQVKQKACPLSGKDIDSKTTIKVSDVDVAFCCGNCQKKASSLEGEKQIELLFNKDAFKKSFELAKAEAKEAAK
jgi:YHS domain-containing protein